MTTGTFMILFGLILVVVAIGIGRVYWIILKETKLREFGAAYSVIFTLVTMVPVTIMLLFMIFVPALHYTTLHEYELMRRKFQAMPDVRLVDSGYVDDLTCEHQWATIEVKGKGILKFRDLDLNAFEGGGDFDICQVGPWGFEILGHVQSPGAKPELTMKSWYIRPELYPQLFPFRIVNVRDVIDHYDEALATVESWPRAPQNKLVMTRRIMTYAKPRWIESTEEIRASIIREK